MESERLLTKSYAALNFWLVLHCWYSKSSHITQSFGSFFLPHTIIWTPCQYPAYSMVCWAPSRFNSSYSVNTDNFVTILPNYLRFIAMSDATVDFLQARRRISAQNMEDVAMHIIYILEITVLAIHWCTSTTRGVAENTNEGSNLLSEKQ